METRDKICAIGMVAMFVINDFIYIFSDEEKYYHMAMLLGLFYLMICQTNNE